MADKTFIMSATGTDNQILTIEGPSSGLQWTIYQLSVETIPFEAGASVIVRRNGRIITTSSTGGRAAAQGPPAIMFGAGDEMTVEWDGVANKDQLLCTLMYTEQNWGDIPDGYGVV